MEMKINFLLMIFTFPIITSFDPFNPNNPYCVIDTCIEGTHTMCVFNRSGPAERCHRVIREGLTDDERDIILLVHNHYRTRVYNGQEERGSPGPQPAAIRNVFLDWDDELEDIAQRWANQCNPYEDICRNVDDFDVGQNIIATDFDEDMDIELELEYLQELIESWYDEVERFDRNNVRNYRPRSLFFLNMVAVHYSQIVWANTTKIGCGAIRFHRIVHPVPKILLVCNYGPKGNRLDEPVYITRE